eukprot:EG_transcript_1041
MADTIRVAIRVRPYAPRDGDGGECVKVFGPLNQIRVTNGQSTESFTFDYVADQHVRQHTVYSNIAENIVEGCLDGYNGTIFAYGQTGSGKTFTMMGPSVEGGDRGLMPRAFERLYMGIQQRERECSNGKLEYLCKAYFLEIYNENIVDLLDPKKAEGINLNHHIREDLKRGVYIEHLTEEICDSAAACNKVLQRGIQGRTQAETQMNRESSRSHAVFCLEVESKHTTVDNLVNFRRARLNLVDLAGSERQKATGVVGKQLKEGCHINKSLSALGCVINALVEVSQGRARHVPFRDSKLTFLLKDSLGGNSRTTVVATVHPNASSFGETLSTLKFAQRAKWVKNQPVVNEDMTNDVQAMKAEIYRLRTQLDRLAQEGPPVPARPPRAPSADLQEAVAACGAAELPHTEAMERVAEWLGGQLRDAQAAAERERERRERAEAAVAEQRGQLETLQMCCNWIKDGPDALGPKGELMAHLNACFEGQGNPFAAELLARCRALEAELAAAQADPHGRRLQEVQQQLRRQVEVNAALHAARQDAVAKLARHAEEHQQWEARFAEQASLQASLQVALKRATAAEERHTAALAGLQQRLEQEAAQVQRLTAVLRVKENEAAVREGRMQAAQALVEQRLSHAKEEQLTAVQELRAELQTQETVVAALKRQEEDLRAEVARQQALQDACTSKQQQIEELQGRLELWEQHCEELKVALEKSQRMEGALRDALEDGESCAKSNQAEYECHIETLKSEVSKLQCEVTALQSSQGTQDLELEMLSGQMRRRDEEAAAKVRMRDQHVEELRRECHRLSAQLPASRSASVLLHKRRRSSPSGTPPQLPRSASAMPKCWLTGRGSLPPAIVEPIPGRASLCSAALAEGGGVGRMSAAAQTCWPLPVEPMSPDTEPDSEVAAQGSTQGSCDSGSGGHADVGTSMSECEESDWEDAPEVPLELLSSPCNRLLGGRSLQELPRPDMSSLLVTVVQEKQDLKHQLELHQQHSARQGEDWEKYREQRRQETSVKNALIESLKEELVAERERHAKKTSQLAKQEEDNAVLHQSNVSLKDAISELTRLRNQNTRIHMFERSMKENSQLKEEQLALKERIKRLQEEKDECLKKLQSSKLDKENVSPNLVSAPHGKRRRVV